MKNIKPFDEFVNEGIRDKMIPKSDKKIKELLSKCDELEKMFIIRDNGLEDLFTEKEMEDMKNDMISTLDKTFDNLAAKIGKILRRDYGREYGFINKYDTNEFVYAHKDIIIDDMKKEDYDPQTLDPEYIVMLLMKNY